MLVVETVYHMIYLMKLITPSEGNHFVLHKNVDSVVWFKLHHGHNDNATISMHYERIYAFGVKKLLQIPLCLCLQINFF